MAAYEKRISWHFEAGSKFHKESWAITSIIGPADGHDGQVHVEETRKNGQEDCHVSAELSKRGGQWVIDHGNVVDELGTEVAAGLVAYLNEHGVPS